MPHSEIYQHRVKYALYILVILISIIIVVIIIKQVLYKTEKFTNPNIASYKAELELFKSMQPDEQVQYINMSRDEKLAIYGSRLSDNK